MRTTVTTAISLTALAGIGLACGGSQNAYSPGGPAPVSQYRVTDSTAGMAQSADEPAPEMNTEAYDHIEENDMESVADSPLSTFSIDVDTASYSNTRRFLRANNLPPRDAVRIEEFVNYFSYNYQEPTGDVPFSVVSEVSAAPWAPERRLVHIGVQGRRIPAGAVPPRNLVFLLDVSGSMNSADKLPLLQQGLTMLVDQLNERDRVSIVVYAGAAGAVLEPTSGANREAIIDAMRRLSAGGSTNGGAGIELAYKLAEKNFNPKAINRVILATDGDFNVGTSDQGSLVRLIEAKRKSGVFLTVLGFGTGNLKDSTMEKLADKGNGNYAYIDSQAEARKVLVNEMGATLVTIAKDVKIQVEFNPALVASYRLVGYENRKLADRDFNDDTKDAGEIGAGHSVTALYEIVTTSPGGDTGAGESAGKGEGKGKVDPLKYQTGRALSGAAATPELMTVKLRYKAPDADTSQLTSFTVTDADVTLDKTSDDFRFSAAVAGFGMLLRDSKYKGGFQYAAVANLARTALGQDVHGYRAEFMDLVATAARLAGQPISTSGATMAQ